MVRQLQEKYLVVNNQLNITALLDLEKAFNPVPRKVFESYVFRDGLLVSPGNLGVNYFEKLNYNCIGICSIKLQLHGFNQM